jgi:hypothetical protein
LDQMDIQGAFNVGRGRHAAILYWARP